MAVSCEITIRRLYLDSHFNKMTGQSLKTKKEDINQNNSSRTSLIESNFSLKCNFKLEEEETSD